MPNNISFFKHLIDENFIFSNEIIENFLLSLRVKPFVILTGNSGTGKTKLAQLFAEYCFNNKINTEDLSKDYITVFTKINNQLPINQGTPSACQFYNILPYTTFELNVHIQGDATATAKMKCTLNARVQNLQPEAVEYINNLKENHFNECIPLYLDEESVKSCYNGNKLNTSHNTFTLKRNGNSSQNNSQWSGYPNDLTFHPITNKIDGVAIGNIYSPFKLELKHKVSFNERSDAFTEAIERIDVNEDIPFEIDFSNFDNKEFIPNYDTEKLYARYEVIPVGANWTDNRAILGYENIITNTYHSTPTLELILRAKEDLEHPYFLILDEMNLSHVERYFADFLSAIESEEPITLYQTKGNDIFTEETESITEEAEAESQHCLRHDGCYTTKNKVKEYYITINGIGDEVPKKLKIPQKLTIPPNLYIIGTVNVDETTYMFSPKVLDRANVLEFETYSINKYMRYANESEQNNNIEPNYNTHLEDFTSIETFEEYDVDNTLRKMNIEDLKKILDDNAWSGLSNELTKFQLVLKESNFDFGFRVTNEIIRYIVASYYYTKNKDNFNWEDTFDNQIKQKILPKLHGSENVIGETLNNLIKLSHYGSEISFDEDEPTELFKELQDKTLPKSYNESKYKNSTKKLLQMKRTLNKQRYMSFIN